IPLAGTRTVLVSGAGARLDDDTMTMPFLLQLALNGAPVVAAESGQDTAGGRGVFVGLVRRQPEMASRVSTVDNLESFIGQAAVGTTFLGNTYQTSNLVSNILFELLAAGVLSSVLVPTFVRYIDAGQRDDAEHVAGAVLGVCLAVLGAVLVVGLALRPLIMRL